MTCQTYIVNDFTIIDANRLGLPHHVKPHEGTDSLTMKFKLYKNDNSQLKKGTFLEIFISDSMPGFRITGSLRKWWFGNKNYKDDFNLKTYILCIKMIAKRLDIPQSDLWHSKLTYLEFGGNCIVSKECKLMLDCVAGFPRRKYYLYEDETIGFKLTKRSTHIIYNKLAEMCRHDGFPANTRKRLEKEIFVFRYELKLNSLQLKKLISKNECTLEDIKENWETLVVLWIHDFMQIEFENKLPNDIKLELTTVTSIKEMLINIGIENYGGIRGVKKMIYSNKKIRKKKEFFQAIIESYEPNRKKQFTEFIDYINSEIFSRAEKCL